MALKNLTDPQQAGRSLGSWLEGRVDDARVWNVQIPTANGLSNETLLLEAAWTDPDSGRERSERLVARVAPTGPALCPAYDLPREARVMRALTSAGLPVPEVLFEEADPSVLGGAFMVMALVDGRIPADDPPFTTDGWVMELEDRERGTLYDNALELVAVVHAADWEALGLGALARPESGETALDQALSHWHATYRWAAEDEINPTIEGAFEWLDANAPSEPEDDVVLTWGDARVGNMVFAEDLSVRGALDWEFAALGARGTDIGWWLVSERFHTDAIGVPRPGGFPAPSHALRRYEEAAGQVVRDLPFHEAFAATRLAILMHRTGNLMVRAGLLPAESTMRFVNPATLMLADMLELPPPEGTAESFVGNR